MTSDFPTSAQVIKLIELALEEDQVHCDVTSSSTIPIELLASGVIIAKERLVVCGIPIIDLIIKSFGESLKLSILHSEGVMVEAGTKLAILQGSARALLATERTILNFLQRLCGVASYTREFVSSASGITVLDTRKTMPGWRLLDKYATHVGGARNHRGDLKSMVLIKNNHIDANSGDIAAVLRATENCNVEVEIEVRNLAELRAALQGKVSYVMLDNMSNQQIVEALAVVAEIKPDVKVEISGGITKQRLPQLAALGVKLVSSGALTTQARNVDISMGISLEK